MNGSYNFLLHLLAFGMVVGVLVPSFILDRKFRAELDWKRKLSIGGIMRTLGAIVPYNVALLTVTGLGNMYNRFLGAPYPWYDEHWLVAKLACFAVLAFNALFIVPARRYVQLPAVGNGSRRSIRWLIIYQSK